MEKIAVIVPCYRCGSYFAKNFEKLKAIEELIDKSRLKFEYVFVDDGSDDNTFEVLSEIRDKHPAAVKVVRLSRNFGAYNAVLAGLYFAEGDYFVAIAADLQEPPEVILEMQKICGEDYRIVLGSRKKVNNPFFSKMSSKLFHFLVKKFIFPRAPDKGFDFFMVDNHVREVLLQIPERRGNLLYLLLWTGYPYALVSYNKAKRKYGKSEWTLLKKINLFADTFFSFSILPLRFLGMMGIIFMLSGFGIFFYYLLTGSFKEFFSLIAFNTGLTGILLFAVNILGEYIFRQSEETKARPLFLVHNYLPAKDEEQKRGKLGFYFDSGEVKIE
jgi:dolichol-phosphate mannosyltransferase